MTDKYKDPLKIDFKDTTKTLIKGAVILGIGIPLVSSLASLVGGSD